MNNSFLKNIAAVQKLSLGNVLLLSGEERNAGKTTLGCRIVKRLSQKTMVIAVKVSPHFHVLTESLKVLLTTDSLVIAVENNKTSDKDSSRYLDAGASKVYYIQCKDDKLQLLAIWMKEHLPENIPAICESGGLRTVINPGHSIHIRQGIDQNHRVTSSYPVSKDRNHEIIFNNFQPENLDSEIKWQNLRWEK